MDLKTMIFAFVIAVSSGISLDAGTVQSTQKTKIASLYDAVKTCNIAEVKKFFNNNPNTDIDEVDETIFLRPTAIYLACCYCRESINIVVYLKDRGADINKTNYLDWTPLHAAAYNDTLDLAKYLVENNADIYKVNKDYGETPGQTEYKFPHPGIRNTAKYLFHVKNYFENLTIVTEDNVNEQGQLINPITIPNYKKLDLLPVVVKKKLQMSLFRDERIRKKLHDSDFLFI